MNETAGAAPPETINHRADLVITALSCARSASSSAAYVTSAGGRCIDVAGSADDVLGTFGGMAGSRGYARSVSTTALRRLAEDDRPELAKCLGARADREAWAPSNQGWSQGMGWRRQHQAGTDPR